MENYRHVPRLSVRLSKLEKGVGCRTPCALDRSSGQRGEGREGIGGVSLGGNAHQFVGYTGKEKKPNFDSEGSLASFTLMSRRNVGGWRGSTPLNPRSHAHVALGPLACRVFEPSWEIARK